MPYSEPHMRLTTRCVLIDGQQEEAVFGLRFRMATTPGETAMEDVYALTNAWLQSPAMNLTDIWAIESMKLAFLDTDGRYTVDALEYVAPTLDAGPGTTPRYPPQVSIAVTTLTDARRGYASRGRFYLPPCSKFINTDGRMDAVDALGMATRTAQWVDEVTDLLGAPAAVFSDVGSGTTRSITAIGVGRVLDTQRRRRRSLLEEREEAPVNP